MMPHTQDLQRPSSIYWGVARPRGIEELTVVLAAAKRLSANRPRLIAGAAAVAIATIAIASSSSSSGDHRAATAINVDSSESPQLQTLTTAKEIAPRLLDPMLRYPIPSLGGTPLPELYTSLASWTHPVVGTERKLPLLPTGHFGAERFGALRVKCGQGHCGADLDGPVGRPIVAVTSGVVMQIDHSRDGKDGRSGRYVRIEHDDGTLTSYMHLNSIAGALEVGDHVEGGQQIGTLGATGTHAAQPHLHFALELPKVPGKRAHASLHYIDPAPFLFRATVRDKADRRRADKPLW